jgi:hypothetical protein
VRLLRRLRALLATRPPGSWRRSAARSAVARGVSWPARAWLVGARLLAGAALLKLAQGGGTGDLRGGWDWVGFRCGIEEKTENDLVVSVVVIVISVESSQAHFAPRFSFVCSMGFRWLFMFGKLVLKACCLFELPASSEGDRKFKQTPLRFVLCARVLPHPSAHMVKGRYTARNRRPSE